MSFQLSPVFRRRTEHIDHLEVTYDRFSSSSDPFTDTVRPASPDILAHSGLRRNDLFRGPRRLIR